MLSPGTLHELNKVFETSPGGFLVFEQGQPRFAVLDFRAYQDLKKVRQKPASARRILVTGGAGYIGSVTTRLLAARGYEVIVYDNLSTGRKERVRNCELVVGDLADKELLRKTFLRKPIDAVIHFAASIETEESTRNPVKYFQNNIVGGLRLLEVMVEQGVFKMIFSSSAAVYGESQASPIMESAPCVPLSPYGETKLMFERILKWYQQGLGFNSVSLRYFNAAGAWLEEELGYTNDSPGTHLIPKILEVAGGRVAEIEIYGQDYGTPDGTCVRDYIHVLDLAEAHLLALQKLENQSGSFVYNVGAGQGYSVSEVIEEAVEITGKMIPMKFTARRPGDPARLVADSSKFQRECGWSPKYDLPAILQSSWDWQQLSR